MYIYVVSPLPVSLSRHRFIQSKSKSFVDVINPATQEIIGRTPLITNEEFNMAVGY